MGRTLPTECPHGVIVDWGDFGPTCPLALEADEEYTEYCLDPEWCPSCYTDCPQCAEKDERKQLKKAKLRRDAAKAAESGDSWAKILLEILDGSCNGQ